MFPTNVPKLAIPRSGFYAGCTRDDLVSILYPFGRESMLSIGPSLSASHRAESKRNRLGGMVRSVSGLFRRDKTNKLKGTASTVEPLSPPVGLRFLGALFDASQEFDGERSKYQGVARLASGSGPADVLNELIDAYSNREPGSNLGSDSSSNLADILAKFPVVPASSSVPAPRVGHLGCSSDIPGGLVVGGRVVSVNRSADPHQDSVSNNTRLIPASSVPFFERRPSSDPKATDPTAALAVGGQGVDGVRA
ncbi:hypothetical protein FRC08_018719 [Ceratobasidium sp. 394]|nr:hypothetical protein FRC08_018719 [Ceratobasidium sp. 394]